MGLFLCLGLFNDFDMMGPPGMNAGSKIETPNVKKRHKRAKSSAKNLDNSQDAGQNQHYEQYSYTLHFKTRL